MKHKTTFSFKYKGKSKRVKNSKLFWNTKTFVCEPHCKSFETSKKWKSFILMDYQIIIIELW